MKKLVTLAVLALVLCMAGNALAVIGWAGNVWPNSGAVVTPNDPVDVYALVWKDGVLLFTGQFQLKDLNSYYRDGGLSWRRISIFRGDA